MPSPYTKSVTRYYPIYRLSCNLVLQTQQPAESSIRYILTNSKTGHLLPKWRQIIRQGGNATTAFDGVVNEMEVQYPYMNASYRRQTAPGVWPLHRTYDSSFSNWLSLGVMSPAGDGALLTKVHNQAVTHLYANLRKARHQLQGGVILGEAAKTAKLLTGAAKRLKTNIADFVVGARKTRSKTSLPARTRRKIIADSYLEATFGWQPLLMDCKDAAVALARVIEFRDRTRIRAAAAEEKVISNGSSEINFAYLYANNVMLEKVGVEVIFRGFLQGTPYTSGIAPLQRIITLSGFDFGSFIPTLWELVPYSFLVDYFTNVGDVLYAMSTDTSIVAGLYRTIRQWRRREYHISPLFEKSVKAVISDGTNINPIVTGQAGYYRCENRSVSREVVAVPYLLPRLKGLDLPWRQYVNIGALFSSKL